MPEQKFEHHIAYIAVRIGIESRDQTQSSVGSGFLYSVPLNDGTDRWLTLLISNKHVFLAPDGKLTISLNKKKSDGTPDFGKISTFEVDGFSGMYFTHPDNEVDLACVNVSAVTHSDVFFMHLDDKFLKPLDYDLVAPGSDVIFVGYPSNRYDMANNLPLIRKGSIASVPEVDFNGRGQIVIDAQVFQGSSGSPVFVAAGASYTLLGVVSETMIRHSQLQTLPANMPQVGVEQILGLGIVVKQRHVQELIENTVKEFLHREGAS